MTIDTIALLSASIKLDLHGLTKDEAKYELIRTLEYVDTHIRAIEIIHGYHKGTTLKNLVRKEFTHPLIEKKLPLDASRTLFVLNFENIKKINKIS